MSVQRCECRQKLLSFAAFFLAETDHAAQEPDPRPAYETDGEVPDDEFPVHGSVTGPMLPVKDDCKTELDDQQIRRDERGKEQQDHLPPEDLRRCHARGVQQVEINRG